MALLLTKRQLIKCINEALTGRSLANLKANLEFLSINTQQHEKFAVVDPLVNSKVARYLDEGYRGEAFLLDNGRVLKVEGLSTYDRQNYRAGQITGKFWDKSAVGTDMPTFGHWIVDADVKDFRGNINTRTFEFIELAYIIEFSEWLERTGRLTDENRDGPDILFEILEVIITQHTIAPSSARMLARLVRQAPEKLFTTYQRVRTEAAGDEQESWISGSMDSKLMTLKNMTLTLDELTSIIFAWLTWVNEKGSPPDGLHSGNYGVDPTNPNKVYLFDVY